MKAEFPDQALRLNVALHMTDTDDLQTSSFQGARLCPGQCGYSRNLRRRNRLSWLPTDTTTLTLAYAYNHGEYEDFEEGPAGSSTPWHQAGNDPRPQDPPRRERHLRPQWRRYVRQPGKRVVFTGNQDFQPD